MSSRVMVTGAAGFIGSHLCERLLEDGLEVTGIDSFTDYYSPGRKERNISRALDNSNFRLIREDLNFCDISGLLDGVECVFHLAAQAGVRRSWGEEFEYYVDSNIRATQRLLESIKKKGAIRLIYSSSSSVYGDCRELPMQEEHPLRPVSPYGATKLTGENLCELYHHNFGMKYAALRYFTVYGPRQRPDMAFSRFITSAMRDESIEIYGDGRQTRDFTYVSDAVEANVLAYHYRGNDRIFNIGGGSRVSLMKVVNMIGEITGTSMKKEFCQPAKGDVRDTWADTERARSELSFKPRIKLEEGIASEIEWYRKHSCEGGEV